MAAALDRECVRWPGLAIVGAGVMGILTAVRAARAGRHVLLIDAVGLAGGQTGHAHGYIHRGNIYRRISRHEEGMFAAAGEFWSTVIDRVRGPLLSHGAAIGFVDHKTAGRSRCRWDRLGIPYERQDPLSSISGVMVWYRSTEIAVKPADLLVPLLDIPGLWTLQASVNRVHAERNGDGPVVVLDVSASGTSYKVEASACVLCNGMGLVRLACRSGISLSLKPRLSFMLVANSEVELPGAFVLPGDESSGLFAVRRRTSHSWTYLLSTASDRTESDVKSLRFLERSWLENIQRVIQRHLPLLWNDPSTSWGAYVAPKVEHVKRRNEDVPRGALVDTGIANVCAVTPGKLTLAPVLVERTHSWCEAALGRVKGRSSLDRPTPFGEPLACAHERWESLHLSSWSDLRVEDPLPTWNSRRECAS